MDPGVPQTKPHSEYEHDGPGDEHCPDRSAGRQMAVSTRLGTAAARKFGKRRHGAQSARFPVYVVPLNLKALDGRMGRHDAPPAEPSRHNATRRYDKNCKRLEEAEHPGGPIHGGVDHFL